MAASPSLREEEEGGEGGWSKLGVGVGPSCRGSPHTVGERRPLLEVVGLGAGPGAAALGGGEEERAAGVSGAREGGDGQGERAGEDGAGSAPGGRAAAGGPATAAGGTREDGASGDPEEIHTEGRSHEESGPQWGGQLRPGLHGESFPGCRLVSPAPGLAARLPGYQRFVCGSEERGGRRAPSPRAGWSRMPAGGETSFSWPAFPSSRVRGHLRGCCGRKGSGHRAAPALSTAAGDHPLFPMPAPEASEISADLPSYLLLLGGSRQGVCPGRNADRG